MDLLALCLATCILYANGDQIKSETDFYPNSLDIACKQLTMYSCPAHVNWTYLCRVEIKRKEKAPSKLHPNAAHTGDLAVIENKHSITLHQACEKGKLDVVKNILAQGLEDINCRGKEGRTPVMTAALKGQVKVFEYLVDQGCDLTDVNDHNSNILHYACLGGSTDIVRTLIVNETIDIESIGFCGRTPIMYAALCGRREVFQLLVKEGCDVLVRDKYKHNILHLACKSGHVDMVRHIISLNIVSIESRGFVGRTPVQTAVRYGKTKVFDLLVGKGCDVIAVDNEKNDILHVASMSGSVELARYIISLHIASIESRGFEGSTPALLAARYGMKAVFDFLVENGCDLSATDDQNNNMLHLACIGGQVGIIQYILEFTKISIESRGFRGRTPVMLAAVNGWKELFDFLVGKGGEITTLDDNMNTILSVACIGGHVDMVKYLLMVRAVGGMKKVKNKFGHTPLQVAEKMGYAAIVSLLRNKK